MSLRTTTEGIVLSYVSNSYRELTQNSCCRGWNVPDLLYDVLHSCEFSCDKSSACILKPLEALHLKGGKGVENRACVVHFRDRLQNSPYFCVFRYARAVKQKVWNETENRERDWGETPHTSYGRVRLARFARIRLLRHALPISLLILRKKPTVLQSTLERTKLSARCFLTWKRARCLSLRSTDSVPSDELNTCGLQASSRSGAGPREHPIALCRKSVLVEYHHRR